MRSYDRIAHWYCRERGAEAGVAEVERALDGLPEGARVLDAGCGDGRPIGDLLQRRGCALTGMDSSTVLLAHFRLRLPGASVIFGDIASYPLPREHFDLVVCWGCLFHLDEEAQARALENLCGALRPGGRLLFTAGLEPGVREGEMGGLRFRYHSLGTDGYRDLLAAQGMQLNEAYLDPFENAVFHAASAAAAACD